MGLELLVLRNSIFYDLVVMISLLELSFVKKEVDRGISLADLKFSYCLIVASSFFFSELFLSTLLMDLREHSSSKSRIKWNLLKITFFCATLIYNGLPLFERSLEYAR
jgi:hypothetical protein